MTEDTKDLVKDVLQTLEHVASTSDMFHSFEVNRAIEILEAIVKESDSHMAFCSSCINEEGEVYDCDCGKCEEFVKSNPLRDYDK